jgi:hypothetical protein
MHASQPTDRPPHTQILDAGSGTSVCVTKAGFPDAVVWNPWVDKSAAMGDFGDEEYKVGWVGVWGGCGWVVVWWWWCVAAAAAVSLSLIRE